MSGLVLFASYTGAAWGSDRVLGDFALGLEPPVAVACPPGELARRLGPGHVEHIPVTARSMEMRRSPADRLATPFRLAALGREVRSAAREREPAVVVGWNARGLLAAGRAAGSARLVFHQNELLGGPVIARAVGRAAAKADLVVAISRTVAEDLGVAAELAPPGVDVGSYEHAWPRPGPPTALYLGALVGWKRPDLALEAVALAAREIPELRLTMAGEPIGRDQRLLDGLRARAERDDLAGRVDFTGRLDDPREALASSHCLLHCADREPYGMVVVEALAAGLPIVAPAAGGPVEILEDGSGRLYPPGDAQAAAHALAGVLQDPEPLGRSARELAERRHSIARSQADYRKLIDPLRRAGRAHARAARARRRP